MGIKSRTKRDRPRIGEVIAIRGLWGSDRVLRCRVDGIEEDSWHLSLGEIFFMSDPKSFWIVGRRLPEPESWLIHEVIFLKDRLQSCDCPACRAFLELKERKLAEYQRGRADVVSGGAGAQEGPFLDAHAA